VSQLRNDIEIFNKELRYSFRISIGTAVADTKLDESTEAMIIRADEDMYIDKCKTKGNCNR